MNAAAIYVRVSTDQQAHSVETQTRELWQIAERRGWVVAEVYTDEGISGAKGRDKRPALDAMLNDASRRKFDVVMAWAIDRVGRSLIDLLSTIQHLEAAGIDLYLDQQNIDTTTPMGKLVFQVTGTARARAPECSYPGARARNRHSRRESRGACVALFDPEFTRYGAKLTKSFAAAPAEPKYQPNERISRSYLQAAFATSAAAIR
jgi:hypothetical protein